jgi:hypothetical protein
MLAIIGVVAIAHAILLLGLADPNPLGPVSQLAHLRSGRISGSGTIDPNIGLTAQALGHRAALDLVHFQLPWWNPYEGTGSPLTGEMQSAALFPPTILLLISGGQLYEHMLLEIIAGISTYLVLRRLALGRGASLAGGIAFALNGTFAWLAHAAVNPVAFLPLLVLGIEFAYDAARRGRRGGWWLIAVAGALSVVAGFPEVTYIDTIFAAVWFAWRLASLAPERRRSYLLKGIGGAVVAALLAAPMWVATLDYLPQAYLAGHGLSVLGSQRFAPEALPQLFLPYVYGPLFAYSDPAGILHGIWAREGGYLTTGLLLFGLLGLFSRERRGLRIVLGTWIMLVLARSYGQIPILSDLLGELPGMDQIQFERYAPATLELAVAILAALGLDDAIRRPRRWRVAAAAVAAVAAVVAAAVGAQYLAPYLGPAYGVDHYLRLSAAWGAVIVLAGAAAVLLLRKPAWRAAAAVLVVSADVFVMFGLPELAWPRTVTMDNAPVGYLRQHLGSGRVFTLGALQPDYGSYYGLQELDVLDSPLPANLARFVLRRLDPYVNPYPGHFDGENGSYRTQSLLRFIANYRAAGVRYVMTLPSQPLPAHAPGLTLVDRTPTTYIYRLSGAQPLMTSSRAGCSVQVRDWETGSVSCPQATRLTYHETDLNGWSASVDGHSVPVHQVNGLFQSVTVPAGRNTVHFSYRPPYETWAELGFLLGLMALAASAVRRVSERGRAPHGRNETAAV